MLRASGGPTAPPAVPAAQPSATRRPEAGEDIGPLQEAAPVTDEADVPWRCTACSFINEVSPDMCVMCDALRHAATDQKAKRSQAGGLTASTASATSSTTANGRLRHQPGAVTAGARPSGPRGGPDGSSGTMMRGQKSSVSSIATSLTQKSSAASLGLVDGLTKSKNYTLSKQAGAVLRQSLVPAPTQPSTTSTIPRTRRVTTKGGPVLNSSSSSSRQRISGPPTAELLAARTMQLSETANRVRERAMSAGSDAGLSVGGGSSIGGLSKVSRGGADRPLSAASSRLYENKKKPAAGGYEDPVSWQRQLR